MNKRMFKNVEWGILICCLILVCIGMIALLSATQDNNNEELRKQILWALISIPIMIIVIFIDYNLIAKISPFMYGIAIISLIAVLFTEPINGASSWFQISENLSIQPSEFVKIVLIIFLAYILVKFQARDKTEINKIWKLALIRFNFRVANYAHCSTTRLWNSYGIYCSDSIYVICCGNR